MIPDVRPQKIMKALFAGLFVFIGMMSGGVLLSSLAPHAPGWLIGISMPLLMLALIAAAFALFNSSGSRSLIAQANTVETLEKKGLLVAEAFEAKRAFQLEEFEDEGAHYFIELVNGSVMYLNGQYLYDYEPIDDDAQNNQSRKFPCTNFSVRRHKSEGYVVDIVCSGTVIEPDGLAPSFDKSDFKRGNIPEDGEIIKGKAYEQIRAERMKDGVEQRTPPNRRSPSAPAVGGC